MSMRVDLLLNASYVLETEAGISVKFYSPTVEHPLYGEGQGTRWAPAACGIISTFIMELMRDPVSRSVQNSASKTHYGRFRQFGRIFYSTLHPRDHPENLYATPGCYTMVLGTTRSQADNSKYPGASTDFSSVFDYEGSARLAAPCYRYLRRRRHNHSFPHARGSNSC